MPAAGIAGFIKAALSVYHGTLPPTLHCDEPNPALDNTRFRLIRRAEPWTDDVRRAGVNAFGFGGINAHVVLESDGKAMPAVRDTRPPVATYCAESTEALLHVLDGTRKSDPQGVCRLVIEDPSEERINRAKGLVEKKRRNAGRHGIWFEPQAPLMNGGKIAFLYPGIEASFAPNIHDLWQALSLAPLPATASDDLEAHGFALIQLERVLTDVLQATGVSPDVLAGHSIGEWTGMIASGMIPETAVTDFVDRLVPGSLTVPGVIFLAAGCGVDKIKAVLGESDALAVSHDNCPHQVILCGKENAILNAKSTLESERILCQILPFRSGFHSPLFQDFVSPHQKHFEHLPIQSARVPLWSATHAAPYSHDPEIIRETAVSHLTEPVRFREVIDGLYAEGVRCFVQLGTGSLTGFVNDTLRGKPHMAMAAVDEQRPALHQLQRLRCALVAAGLDINPAQVLASENQTTPPPVPLALGVPLVHLDHTLPLSANASPDMQTVHSNDPVIQEFNHMLQDVVNASTAVVEAYQKEPTATPPEKETAKRSRTTTRMLSVDTCPALVDHAFFRQPDDWPHMADRFPVVPLTMLIEIMVNAAQELAPNQCIVSVHHLRAYKWLVVEPAVEITIQARWASDDRIRVAIEGYAECVLEVQSQWPTPPDVEPWSSPPGGEGIISNEALYDERWMFHGPAYQGVESIDSISDAGIRGTLLNIPAEGALLDNVGQLLGYWVMIRTTVDRLAMPITVDSIRWYGPALDTNQPVECRVHIRKLSDRQVRADMTLLVNDRVWAVLSGWTDQRFDTNERSWPVIQYPKNHLLSEPVHNEIVILEDIFNTSASQDYYHRRYLNTPERAQYAALSDLRKGSWLAGRIAAKDAVRSWLWEHEKGPVFPVEVGIDNEETGQPVILGQQGNGLHLSIAHKGSMAVARVGTEPVGVDIEHIESRTPRFVDNALTAEEQAHLPETDRDEWVTRFWAAKEAAGKRNGTGLNGSPRNVLITDVQGTRVCADGVWVDTEKRGQTILAWTVNNQEHTT